MEFELYQDLKYSMTGMITDSEFANMIKKYFMSILAMRVAKMIKGQHGEGNMVRVSTGDLSREDQNRANRCIDDHWLDYLGMANMQFSYQPIRQETQRRGEPA